MADLHVAIVIHHTIRTPSSHSIQCQLQLQLHLNPPHSLPVPPFPLPALLHLLLMPLHIHLCCPPIDLMPNPGCPLALMLQRQDTLPMTVAYRLPNSIGAPLLFLALLDRLSVLFQLSIWPCQSLLLQRSEVVMGMHPQPHDTAADVINQ